MDDDELPPRHVLEAHTVPELPHDFADRVMGALQHAPVIAVTPRRNALPWTIAACTSAIAIAATLLLVWPRPAEPEPAIVIATPEPAIAVAVPTPAAPRQLAHLVLTVEPRDATVRVDGQPIAGPSPFVATNLAAGNHVIAVAREGYEEWTRTIDVPAGELDLPITLSTIAAAAPPTNTPARVVPRKPRSSTSLEDPRHETGASPDLMDPFAAFGTVRIGTNAGSGPAQVFVDGNSAGLTPIAALRLSPGQHSVKWKWPDGREIVRGIVVEAGKVLVVKNG